MHTPAELRRRAEELENRVAPASAGPRTDDERMFLGKARVLRAQADNLESAEEPGTVGTLQQRVAAVIENEVQ